MPGPKTYGRRWRGMSLSSGRALAVPVSKATGLDAQDQLASDQLMEEQELALTPRLLVLSRDLGASPNLETIDSDRATPSQSRPTSAQPQAPSPATPPPVRRKRGRPLKDPNTVITQPASETTPRPRGRPRKETAVADTVETFSAIHTTPRKRGRPREEPTGNTPRARGRARRAEQAPGLMNNRIEVGRKRKAGSMAVAPPSSPPKRARAPVDRLEITATDEEVDSSEEPEQLAPSNQASTSDRLQGHGDDEDIREEEDHENDDYEIEGNDEENLPTWTELRSFSDNYSFFETVTEFSTIFKTVNQNMALLNGDSIAIKSQEVQGISESCLKVRSHLGDLVHLEQFGDHDESMMDIINFIDNDVVNITDSLALLNSKVSSLEVSSSGKVKHGGLYKFEIYALAIPRVVEALHSIIGCYYEYDHHEEMDASCLAAVINLVGGIVDLNSTANKYLSRIQTPFANVKSIRQVIIPNLKLIRKALKREYNETMTKKDRAKEQQENRENIEKRRIKREKEAQKAKYDDMWWRLHMYRAFAEPDIKRRDLLLNDWQSSPMEYDADGFPFERVSSLKPRTKRPSGQEPEWTVEQETVLLRWMEGQSHLRPISFYKHLFKTHCGEDEALRKFTMIQIVTKVDELRDAILQAAARKGFDASVEYPWLIQLPDLRNMEAILET